ncbi:MAG: hypothetical protein ACJ8M4_12725 [Chthoniobacterales bacterium]
MRIIVRSVILGIALAGVTAFAAQPPVTVTVSNSGKTSFKGQTDSKGTFATGKLKPGNYTVQFNSTDAGLKGKQYAVVVSAGKKKVSANVPGEKFAGGGVAMKVDVGDGLNITGQVAAQTGPASPNGKKMVWIPPMLGSNQPGHWAEEDSAEAKQSRTRGVLSRDSIEKVQQSQVNPGGN